MGLLAPPASIAYTNSPDVNLSLRAEAHLSVSSALDREEGTSVLRGLSISLHLRRRMLTSVSFDGRLARVLVW